jgi:transcriptional regulator with XRE-family HTH domain
MTSKTARLPEVWMVLTDRKKLAKLMLIQGVSGRQLAAAAGYRSHTYLQRLLRGEVTTLDVDPAVRIALFLGVGVDDLFVARTDSDAGRSVQQSRTVAA